MAHIHCVIFIVKAFHYASEIEIILKNGYVILFLIHLCTNLDLLDLFETCFWYRAQQTLLEIKIPFIFSLNREKGLYI